uniref:Uncharacterized protein n=1 Tax=Trypanosoma congolense (strain IL3000) TaxID=1068625 RepID=G0UZG8_TRYCI|nr:conserved hypothetical protein [Trypanosoma congolense IL3000]
MPYEGVSLRVKLGDTALNAHNFLCLERQLTTAGSIIRNAKQTLLEAAEVAAPGSIGCSSEWNDYTVDRSSTGQRMTHLPWYTADEILCEYYRVSCIISDSEQQAREQLRGFYTGFIDRMQHDRDRELLMNVKYVHERLTLEEDALSALACTAQEHLDFILSVQISEEDERQEIVRQVELRRRDPVYQPPAPVSYFPQGPSYLLQAPPISGATPYQWQSQPPSGGSSNVHHGWY